jgi:hypothetical protein
MLKYVFCDLFLTAKGVNFGVRSDCTDVVSVPIRTKIKVAPDLYQSTILFKDCSKPQQIKLHLTHLVAVATLVILGLALDGSDVEDILPSIKFMFQH